MNLKFVLLISILCLNACGSNPVKKIHATSKKCDVNKHVSLVQKSVLTLYSGINNNYDELARAGNQIIKCLGEKNWAGDIKTTENLLQSIEEFKSDKSVLNNATLYAKKYTKSLIEKNIANSNIENERFYQKLYASINIQAYEHNSALTQIKNSLNEIQSRQIKQESYDENLKTLSTNITLIIDKKPYLDSLVKRIVDTQILVQSSSNNNWLTDSGRWFFTNAVSSLLCRPAPGSMQLYVTIN